MKEIPSTQHRQPSAIVDGREMHSVSRYQQSTKDTDEVLGNRECGSMFVSIPVSCFSLCRVFLSRDYNEMQM